MGWSGVGVTCGRLVLAVGLGVVLALSMTVTSALARRYSERELQLQEPRSRYESEGGRLEVWENIRPVVDAELRVEAARIILRQRGLLLPKYTDAAHIAFVEEGEGLVGLTSGYSLGNRARRVRRGDVVVIPKGLVQWWYNSGSQDPRITVLADTSDALERRGQVTAFFLAGSRSSREPERIRPAERRYEGAPEEERHEEGSILHGFRTEFLAEAWDLEENEVQEILGSQRGAHIVRVDRDIDISNAIQIEDSHDSAPHATSGGKAAPAGLIAGEYIYNVREGTPDIRVEEAGHVNIVNRLKLPLLQHLNLGLVYGRLERDATFAPSWDVTGHEIFHVLKGNGRLEIAGNGGQQVVSQSIKEGDVFFIPRFHPTGLKAGDGGLEFVTFFTTNLPYYEAVAGKTSVFNNLPDPVAAAAFNVDEERVRKFRDRRLKDALLLPPGSRRDTLVHGSLNSTEA